MKEEKSGLERLVEGWEWCVGQRDSSVYARQRLNYETRYCVWENQSLDGRKWKAARGKEIFPWEGASDARVPLVDKYINEDVAFLMTVRRRMRTLVSGVGVEDAGWGNRVTQLLRWQQYTQMPEWIREHRLFASYGLESGAALMKVYWCQERVLEYRDLDMEGLAVQATESAEMATLIALILDEGQEKAAALKLLGLLDVDGELGLTEGKVRKLVRALRTEGHGKIALPTVVKDGPAVKALRLNVDVFLPPEATGVGDEVYERELLSEGQLRERVGSLGWDEEWVKQVIESQKGRMSGVGIGELRVVNGGGSGGSSYGVQTTSRLYEVVHAYRKVWDEEGVPEVRYTVFSPGMIRVGSGELRVQSGKNEFPKGSVAFDGPLGYGGGELPFVLFEREKRGELVDEARGYGEVAATMQRQIKVEWDARVDRNSMATLPPMYHKPGHEPERWGPGCRMPLMRSDEVGFVEAPKYDPGSKLEEDTVRRFADEYFGRVVDEQNMVEGQTLKQALADTWMEACGAIDRWVLRLDQKFLPEEIAFRVVGAAKGRSMRMSREEIQGSFDLMVGYNTENLDGALKEAKIGLMERALAMDVNGILDRDAVLEVVFELVDPSLGERILRPGEEARQLELEDEDLAMAKMSAGIPVDIKQGQAHGLRLERLKELLMRSPVLQKRYQTDENFRNLVEWRGQQLGHQLEQRENAQIGRLGGKKGFEQFAK